MPRILAAVTYTGDGGSGAAEVVEVVNIGRPAALAAFGDKFGKTAPTSYNEVAWLAHRALRIEQPLDEWLESLEDLDSSDTAVERAQRQLRGDLSPCEQLEALSAVELLELTTPGGELESLWEAARVELQARRPAAIRLAELTDAEREAMPADDLQALEAQAAVEAEQDDLARRIANGETVTLDPSTPVPATTGESG